MGCLSIKGKRIGALHITGSLVCDINKGEKKYLKVPSKRVRWITPDYELIYNVKSNTDWVTE